MTTTSRLAIGAAAALATALLAVPATATAAPPPAPSGTGHTPTLSWRLLPTPTTTARLRGLSPVSAKVIWASGSEGVVLRSTDGGRTVRDVGPAGTEGLQFRDIEATSARHAVILSIGEATDSRVYVTDDGGATWAESFRNTDPAAFYDCMTFTSPRVGYALSDPPDGKFRIIRTTDAGRSWRVMSDERMPAALPGEAAFAASGTCLQNDRAGNLYIATGGVDPARVFRSTDAGRSWTVQDSPVAGAAAGGIFSLSFGRHGNGVAVGGDFTVPEAAVSNAAWTSNAGRTWHPARGLGGYRSGSAWVDLPWPAVLAVGPTGSDVSLDGGRHYRTFDTGTFDSVECVPGACFASGDVGRLAVLRLGLH